MGISQAQQRANELNAQKSTGPRTEEGKAIASRNSLKHGLCAKKRFAPHEDAEAYAKRHADFAQQLNPTKEWKN